MSEIIRTENVTVQFGNYQALEEISLSLDEGSFVTIVGPNGSGKSTFLKLLLGVEKPAKGTIKVFNMPPQEVSPKQIGYVPQVKTLDRSFPALSIDLVATGIYGHWPARVSKEARNHCIEALGRVGAEHLAKRPLGKLSGGELQRIYLARTFVRKPELVLLDEPATGIDAVGEQDMLRHLDDYHRETGATILMVTHDWLTARHHASHVLVLNRKLIAFGHPDTALTEDIMRRAFGHMGHIHMIEGKGHNHV
jgi:zinc transport system ATP-binding protein